MVFYIRFLKTPRFQAQKGQKAGSCSVSALVCITTDLGDSFLSDDVHLLVTLALAGTSDVHHVISRKVLVWNAGNRELPISLGPFPSQLARRDVVLGVNATDPRKPSSVLADHLSSRSGMPLVISGWSAPFGGSQSQTADRLIQRRLDVNGKLEMNFWEETGNSIARHVWDAGLASVVYLQSIMDGQTEAMPSLQKLLQSRRDSDTPLRVLELGTGCGLVGLALSRLHSQCSVVLTDLPEVEDIVTRNIAAVQPVAPSSAVEFQVLDWDQGLPEYITGSRTDLILVSDCTYNADSLPALISVMDKLVQLSPDVTILVAMKRRHDSETVFFELMQSAKLRVLHQDSMKLPSQHDEEDWIELYAYRRSL